MFFGEQRNALLQSCAASQTAFWRDFVGWPTNPPGFVFLGEAVHQVGIALFPDQWNRLEPTANIRQPMDRQLTTSTPSTDISRAGSLLRTHDEAYRQRAGHPSLLSSNPMPTDEEWQRAILLADKQDNKSTQSFKRFYKVYRYLHDHFFHDRIGTATRPNAGGSLTRHGPDFWYVERCLSRFIKCRVLVAAPYEMRLPPDDADWIFVEETSFNKALRRLTNDETDNDASEENPASEHLSEYLRFMVELAQKMKLSPENQPKKSFIEHEILSQWPGEKPLSNREVELMATFLREPASKLGRAKKRQDSL